MKKMNCLIISFLACFMVFFSAHESLSGGREKPANAPVLAGVIQYTAWYEDQMINVALANTSESPHHLTVSTGTSDVGTTIYASQQVQVPANSIQRLQFPALKQKTVRGDLRVSDSVFIYSNDPGISGLVASGTIQNIGQDNPSAFLDAFVINSKAKARFNYKINADKSLKIVLIAKSIKGSSASMSGKVKKGKCTTNKNIEKLNIPASYKNDVIKHTGTNFCFIVDADKDATIAVEYKVPMIDKCDTVQVPVNTYSFTPSGGVSVGGQGSGFMIYNSGWAKMATVKADVQMNTGRIPPSK